MQMNNDVHSNQLMNDISQYKRLVTLFQMNFQLDKVSSKIEKWHSLNQANREDLFFQRDEEYVEMDRSPTNFDSSSDESDLATEIILNNQRDKSMSRSSKRKNKSMHLRKASVDGGKQQQFQLNLQETTLAEENLRRAMNISCK